MKELVRGRVCVSNWRSHLPQKTDSLSKTLLSLRSLGGDSGLPPAVSGPEFPPPPEALHKGCARRAREGLGAVSHSGKKTLPLRTCWKAVPGQAGTEKKPWSQTEPGASHTPWGHGFEGGRPQRQSALLVTSSPGHLLSL